jgi:tRNA-dihydrouridine synthase
MQARDLLEGRRARPAPTPEERFATALEHARLAVMARGDQRKTVIEFRKHLGWYTSGLRAAAGLRQQLLRVESMNQAAELFAAYLERGVLEPAA